MIMEKRFFRKKRSLANSLKTGIGFGLTSATITTLGLMVGLYSGTNSKFIVLAGILTIAVADAFSDALGIHISEEAKNKFSDKEVWLSTLFTFLAKFIFTLTFVIPVLIFQISTAVLVSIIWGMIMLGALSYKIARDKKENPAKVIGEHLIIAAAVIIIANYIGNWLANTFY